MAEPASSPLAAALDSVGDRWTLLLVEALLDGPRRFGDLQEQLPRIAPNVLTQRLRRLESEGLVVAQPYSERPQRYVYELTSSGHELAGALRLLADWGARHGRERRAAAARRLRHPGRGALVVPDLRAPGRRRRRGRPALRIVRQRSWRLIPSAPVEDQPTRVLEGGRRPSAAALRRRAAAWAEASAGREPEEVYRRRRLIAAGAGGARLSPPDRPDRERRRRRPRAEEHAVRPRRGRHEHLQGVGPRADQHQHDRDRHHGHARGAHHAAGRRHRRQHRHPGRAARLRERAEAWARRRPLRRPPRRRARAAAPRRRSPRAPGAVAAA